LHIPSTILYVSTGWMISPFLFVGTFTLWNLRLVLLLYCSCSSILVSTLFIVLGICNKDLGLKLDINHIGRSHPIGEPKDGKIAIITRFLTYRQRQLVFRNKKKLKGNPDKMYYTSLFSSSSRISPPSLYTSFLFLVLIVRDCSVFLTSTEPSCVQYECIFPFFRKTHFIVIECYINTHILYIHTVSFIR
jgi:hypothetical protein